MGPQPSDNMAFWNRFARFYDRFMARFSPDYPALIERLDRDMGDARRILDVATGTGLIALGLANADREVHGVDLSQEMLNQAAAKATDMATALQFRVGSVYELPYRDGSFDAVVCANALHMVSEPERALDEINRVLVPGGRAFLPTYCHAQTRRSRALSRLMCLSGFRVYTRFSEEMLRRMVTSAGFTVIASDLSDDTMPLCYLSAMRQI